jgi:uncharacterized protein YdhG (YjbR/CyaY superfamily)
MKPEPKFQEIEDYLAAQPERARKPLEKIREIIRKALPDAEEAISYQMPSFKYHGMIAWYAPSKNHFAIYMRPKFLLDFKDQLSAYSQTKSAVHFNYNQQVPEALITEMALAAARENMNNKIAKDAAKNSKPKKEK